MISIIIPWRDRIEIAQALPSLLASAEALDGEVLIVNFAGSSDQLSQMIGAARVRVITLHNQKYFSKTCANNLGAHFALKDLFFFCDADILAPPGVISELVQKLWDSRGCFATIAGVRETEPNSRKARNVVCFGYELNIKLANGRSLQIVDHEEDAESGGRQAPGLLFVRRADFLSIDGYNSELVGWGWEDQDMIARLTLGGGFERITDGAVEHISHDDESRVRHYPYAPSRWENRDRMFRQCLDNYDRGDFNGTFTRDVARWGDACLV